MTTSCRTKGAQTCPLSLTAVGRSICTTEAVRVSSEGTKVPADAHRSKQLLSGKTGRPAFLPQALLEGGECVGASARLMGRFCPH